MDTLAELLNEPLIESVGGASFVLLMYKVIAIFLSVYGKREDTEQAEAEAEKTESEALIAKEETSQKLIDVLVTTSSGMTAIKDAILSAMAQSNKTETAVVAQATHIEGLSQNIGKATDAMTLHTEKVDSVGQGIMDKLDNQTTAEQYDAIIVLLRELKIAVMKSNEVTSGLVTRVETVETTVEVWADRVKKETQETKQVKPDAAPSIAAKTKPKTETKKDETK